MLVGQSLAAFYSGRGLTRVVMWVDAFFALVNVLLDYLWIFGHAGFPALGIAGAGWATVASLWLKAATYVYLVLQPRHRQEFATLTGLRFDRELFQRFLYYGGPSGIQMLLDVLGFTVFVMLVGRLGSAEYEATSMAFSVSTLGFMPILGLGLAATILVGHRLGENRDDLAARSTWTTLWISWAYMAGVSALYVLVPGMFLFWFFAGTNEADSAIEETWQLSVKLLRFVAAYNLLDATLIIFVSAIKGAGDTRFVLQVSLIMSALLAGLSWLCVEVFQWGVYGCWSLITAWVCVLGMIFWWRFVQGKWRTMRVIEQRSGQPLMGEAELATAERISSALGRVSSQAAIWGHNRACLG